MPNNPGKVNQDSFILCPNVHQAPYTLISSPKAEEIPSTYPCHMFGVCDGHGHNGRDVS
jgi:hypothetical protein